VDHNVFCLPLLLSSDQLGHIGVVTACQTSVGGDDNDRLFGGSPRNEILMFQMTYPGQDIVYGIIHTVKIRLRTFCTCSGSLKLYRRYQLHGLGDLLCALNAGLTALDITH